MKICHNVETDFYTFSIFSQIKQFRKLGEARSIHQKLYSCCCTEKLFCEVFGFRYWCMQYSYLLKKKKSKLERHKEKHLLLHFILGVWAAYMLFISNSESKNIKGLSFNL